MQKVKIIRTSTIPMSLNILLKGQLRYLNQYFEIVGLSSAGKDLQEVENREGVRTITVNMERGISPFKDLVSLIKLYAHFLKEKPTLVHSITPKAGLLTMLAGKMAGVPIRVHTFTGLIFPSKQGLLQKILIKMDRLLCSSATHIYPEGNGVKNDLIKYNITKKPLNIIANGNVNGVDTAYFHPDIIDAKERSVLRELLHISEADFVYVFVGRIVRDKGINELIDAFKKVNSTSSKLILVGPSEQDLDPVKQETINEIETNQNIISVGFQNDIRRYLAIADVLVFPSYREGFPNVVLQAGAMGIPAIVTNINGSNEIIEHLKNGIIIDVKDSSQLQEAMELVMNDPQLHNNLKSNARSSVVSRFEQSMVWNSILQEYYCLLKDRGN